MIPPIKICENLHNQTRAHRAFSTGALTASNGQGFYIDKLYHHILVESSHYFPQIVLEGVNLQNCGFSISSINLLSYPMLYRGAYIGKVSHSYAWHAEGSSL